MERRKLLWKYYKFARLYRLSSPSTVKRRLQKYCDRVSEALSVVQGLNEVFLEVLSE